jgi:hypothetical protein
MRVVESLRDESCEARDPPAGRRLQSRAALAAAAAINVLELSPILFLQPI